MREQLEHLARRVTRDPFFLAAVLHLYAQEEGLDDIALAAQLHCPQENLVHLRLCRNPNPQPPQFWQEVQRIAQRFGVDPDVLAEVVRHGQNLLRLQPTSPESAPAESGFLMAARDAEPEDEAEGKSP